MGRATAGGDVQTHVVSRITRREQPAIGSGPAIVGWCEIRKEYSDSAGTARATLYKFKEARVAVAKGCDIDLREDEIAACHTGNRDSRLGTCIENCSWDLVRTASRVTEKRQCKDKRQQH